MDAVSCNKPGCFFIDGPGGTGKTFLYRALLAKIRSEGHVALATATSGIATSLLPGGRTAHSRFKIPLDAVEGFVCKVSKQSSLAVLIRICKLIIWDEAPMAKKSAIESLDSLLTDIMECSTTFGGKVVVLGGDFRQTLPVVRLGTNRKHASSIGSFFSSFLLALGNGIGTHTDDAVVSLPSSMLIQGCNDVNGLEALMKYVYPNIFVTPATFSPTCNRVVLTTKNTFVDEINDTLIYKLPGEEIEYFSLDETIDPNDQAQYEDLLHSLTPNEISYGEFAGKEVPVDLCNYRMHGISLLFNEKGCNLLTWYRNHTPLEQYSIRK
ncbi:unnamed protein product [Lactuca saligna]|uniref:ATP-dependent DNA helicase n=1 Tax=Lactuca saligna TaxID=75948 RepID=A0AA35ZKJ2_LACSI|nr:unnamed protein product [Lactuca saligna]